MYFYFNYLHKFQKRFIIGKKLVSQETLNYIISPQGCVNNKRRIK